MTTKHSEVHSRKGKKKSESYTLPTTSKDSQVAYKVKDQKQPKSVGLFDEQIKKQKKKKTKSRARKLVSLSIVAYLTYTSLYACGSPFDESTEKPAICAAIDPIKLDLYSLYQSNYYKTNVDPYVGPVVNKSIEYYHQYAVPAYHNYGVPAQIKLNEFYWKQAKPTFDRCIEHTVLVYNTHVHPLYHKHVHPVYIKKVAPVIKPYVDQAKPHMNKAKSYIDQAHPYYQNQIKPLYHQATEKALQSQEYIRHQYDNLPPSVKQVEMDIRNKIMAWVDHAENLEMAPILRKIYWSIVDFYQLHFLPVFHSTYTVTKIKMFYNENAKEYVDQKLMPLIGQVNNKVHLDTLFHHFLSLLPEREIIQEEPVYTAKSAYTQIKTSSSIAVPKTQTVPITPAASIKTVTISKSVSSTSDTAVPASTTMASSTINSQKPQPTLAKSAEINDDDIVRKVKTSVRPLSTYTPDPNAAPDADKKEAIYCPTCNAQEEQLIVANTEKNVAPVRTDKHVIPVPTDNEVFEVHEETLDIPSPPSSPNKDFDNSDQVVIQAPIPQKETPTVKEEDIIYSIQTEVPSEGSEEQIVVQAPIPHKESPIVTEEDIVYSIQTEVPTASAEEDIVFSIQTETPTATAEEDIVFSIQTEASIETNIEDKLEEEHHEEIDQKIVEEIRHEAKKEEMKKEENIFVPPAIKNEELVLESRADKPIEDEDVFVKVEEPKVEEAVHFEEPIVKVEEPVQCEEPIDVVPAAKSDDKIVEQEQSTLQTEEEKLDKSDKVEAHVAKEEHPPVVRINKPLAKQQIELPVEQ